MNRSEVWTIVEPVVLEAGLRLFDIDLPSGSRGTLRIFLSRSSDVPSGAGRDSITLDDCVRVNARLKHLEAFEQLIPEGILVEVSSPGINRRLRREEHFQGALGEHVKVKVCDSKNKRSVVTGTLREYDGSALRVEEDRTQHTVEIPVADIVEARVDYVFQ